MTDGGSNRRQDIYHLVGTTLKGRYYLEEFVDEGGMSIVYRARDLVNQSAVAVKILAPRFLTRNAQSELYLRLFRQEAELAQQLKHPNIVSVYDSGVENTTAFIVMEWLDGRTLGEEINSKGALPPARAADVLRQICSALDYAHRRKVIHLDLKPNNIFLIDGGASHDLVKVIDFGLSRIIQSTLGTTISRVVGTPYYIAPEVFAKKAGRLSDVYSLGVMSYEMLTGLMPFGNSHIYALIHQHIEQPPPSARAANREVPELVDDLIKRAMSKTPTFRPKSAREFYEEFARSLRSVDASQGEKVFNPVVYVDKPSLKIPFRAIIGYGIIITLLLVMFASEIYFIRPYPNLIGVDLSRIHSLQIYLTASLLFCLVTIGRMDDASLIGRVVLICIAVIFSPLLLPLTIIGVLLLVVITIIVTIYGVFTR